MPTLKQITAVATNQGGNCKHIRVEYAHPITKAKTVVVTHSDELLERRDIESSKIALLTQIRSVITKDMTVSEMITAIQAKEFEV